MWIRSLRLCLVDLANLSLRLAATTVSLVMEATRHSVEDNGRGIPAGTYATEKRPIAEVVTTVLHTGSTLFRRRASKQ